MKQPITYAKVQVFRPSTGLPQHTKIQQHIGVAAQEPDFATKKATIVVTKADLKRLFGEETPREFYIMANGLLTYVALKTETGLEGEERFGTAIALNEKVLDAIFDQEPLAFGDRDMLRPWLKMIILANEFEIEKLAIKDRVMMLDSVEYDLVHPMFQWNQIAQMWAPNDDPIEKSAPAKQRLHLKDIPLTNRANRRLVRATIEQHREALEDAHVKSASQLSFDEWMVQNQGVNIIALQQLQGIDELDDDEYVDAMVKFKQAEVTGYHNVEVQAGKTEKHLFEWCLENFGEEFNHVGRKDAEAEISEQEIDPEIEDDSGHEEVPAVFVITFDGTIVEDQRPAAIGPESPYAIATMKALMKNGHHIFILTGRTGDDRYAMFDFFKASEFTPTGTTRMLLADDVLTKEEAETCAGVSSDIDEALDSPSGLGIDYVIDHKQFGIAVIQISGKANASPTVFWGDLVEKFRAEGYLTEEDVGNIMNDLHQQMESL